jgi:hypothetical protein
MQESRSLSSSAPTGAEKSNVSSFYHPFITEVTTNIGNLPRSAVIQIFKQTL